MAQRSITLQILLAAILTVASSVALADTMTLPATRDNTLYEDSLGSLSNGSGEFIFVGRTQGGLIRRGLLRFDLSTLPNGVRVNSVELHLHISRTQVAGVPVYFHRVLADWGEGASNSGNLGGTGAIASLNDATWVHRFHATASWLTAGGEFDPVPSGQFTANGFGPYSWPASAIMLSDIQYWIENPEANFGWCLIGDESAQSTNRFNSRENIAASVRPRLIVDFNVPMDCSGTPVTTGDTDGSDTVNGVDIQGFVSSIVEGAAGLPTPRRCASDINGDGFVDDYDVPLFVSLILAG